MLLFSVTSLVFCPVLTEFFVLPSDKQPGVVRQEPPECIGHNKKCRIKGRTRSSQVRDPQRRPSACCFHTLPSVLSLISTLL